jgi:hypothetical protein
MAGNNLLTFEVAKQYIKNFLELEIKNVLKAQNSKLDYCILSQENKINFIVPLEMIDKKINVKIEGFVDRIGLYGNQIQLVDYKTGSVSSADLSFKSWRELAENPKKSKALQLALYSYIYLMQNPEIDDFVSGIYSFRNLQVGLLQLKWKGKKVTAQDIRDNFAEVIELVVLNMLSTSSIFKHNVESKYCNYCC